MSETMIVICHRRWIFVGVVSAEEGSMGREIVVRRAKTIRQWGTTHGLGELVNGPTDKTKLDTCGTVRLHPMQVIGRIEVNAKAWEKHLGA